MNGNFKFLILLLLVGLGMYIQIKVHNETEEHYARRLQNVIIRVDTLEKSLLKIEKKLYEFKVEKRLESKE
jgi:hypothetical protein